LISGAQTKTGAIPLSFTIDESHWNPIKARSFRASLNARIDTGHSIGQQDQNLIQS
jgi:hypothetical protein